MGLGVVAYRMAAGGNFADDGRTGTGELTDEKKRGAGLMAIQQIEETRCEGRVRTVVEGQRDRPIVWKTPKDRPEEWRSRMVGSPGESAGRRGDPGQHGIPGCDHRSWEKGYGPFFHVRRVSVTSIIR